MLMSMEKELHSILRKTVNVHGFSFFVTFLQPFNMSNAALWLAEYILCILYITHLVPQGRGLASENITYLARKFQNGCIIYSILIWWVEKPF